MGGNSALNAALCTKWLGLETSGLTEARHALASYMYFVEKQMVFLQVVSFGLKFVEIRTAQFQNQIFPPNCKSWLFIITS